MSATESFVLDNGLKVVHSFQHGTAMAALAVAYDVGARDEDPALTGMAHLIEHMMFGGSANVPEFDAALQRAGAVNNAWTTNDITCYHELLPAANIETAFWAESDRLLNPAFTPRVFETQRSVVIEEFKERCLNQPYGDRDHLLRSMMYRVHPYRYPTIGKEIAHLERVTLDDVRRFFESHYSPDRATLAVAGSVSLEETRRLATRWFGGIAPRKTAARTLPVEPPIEDGPRRLEVERDVPQTMITIAYAMGGRRSPDYIPADLMSDILASGQSARLEQRLVVNGDGLFSKADACILGSDDPGLFMLSGRLQRDSDADIAEAERRLRYQAALLAEEGVSRHELTRVQNRYESLNTFAMMDLMPRAVEMAVATLQGDSLQAQMKRYRAVTPDDILNAARRIIRPENSGVLVIRPSKNNHP